MKIGLFTDAYFPIISGVSLSVETLAKELRKRGHDVYVIAHFHEHAVPEDYVIRMRGVRLPMKGMKEYRIGKVTRKQVQEMLSYEFDIVHCHTEFSMGRLGRRTARKAGIPVVHTYHTMYEDYVHFISKTLVIPLRFLAIHYSKRFANSANAVIFPTIKVKRTFDGYGYKGNGSIIPTGIYLDKFTTTSATKEQIDAIRQQYNITKNKLTILFLGRVSREKSIDQLIDSFAKIKHKDVQLMFVGDGPDRPGFEKQVDKLGIRDRVCFVGMVGPDEVAPYYQAADLFVNFSVTETQGLTYIESLASGTPLLVKYDDNLEGVVQQGMNGFTFQTQAEFLSLFEDIYQQPALLDSLKHNASKAMDQFSAATYATQVEDIYKSLYKG